MSYVKTYFYVKMLSVLFYIDFVHLLTSSVNNKIVSLAIR